MSRTDLVRAECRALRQNTEVMSFQPDLHHVTATWHNTSGQFMKIYNGNTNISTIRGLA